jgi:hypothetical protein
MPVFFPSAQSVGSGGDVKSYSVSTSNYYLTDLLADPIPAGTAVIMYGNLGEDASSDNCYLKSQSSDDVSYPIFFDVSAKQYALSNYHIVIVFVMPEDDVTLRVPYCFSYSVSFL